MARIILRVLLFPTLRIGLLILVVRVLTSALILALLLLISVAGVLLPLVLLVSNLREGQR